MTAVPAIYGALSEAATAAYAAWLDALMVRADHLMRCQCCQVFTACCPDGQALVADEQAAWARWYELRTGRMP